MGERPESVELTTLLTIKRQPDTASSSSHCSQRPWLPWRSDSKASQQMRQPAGQMGTKATISLRVIKSCWFLYELILSDGGVPIFVLWTIDYHVFQTFPSL